MKVVITFAVMSLLQLAAATAPASAQDNHKHSTAATHAAYGQRWDTDAPLRAGMAKIRIAMDALEHHEHGHMGPEPAVALATQIEQQIAFLVANCKLKPQADAALHVIISQLGAGAQALKANPADRSVIPSMRHALQSYSLQFKDPVQSSADELEEKR